MLFLCVLFCVLVAFVNFYWRILWWWRWCHRYTYFSIRRITTNIDIALISYQIFSTPSAERRSWQARRWYLQDWVWTRWRHCFHSSPARSARCTEMSYLRNKYYIAIISFVSVLFDARGHPRLRSPSTRCILLPRVQTSTGQWSLEYSAVDKLLNRRWWIPVPRQTAT